MACLSLPLAVLFIPIAAARSQNLSLDDDGCRTMRLHSKAAMLNPTFFYLRIVAYFAIWIVLSFSLRRFSVAQDKDGAAVWTHRMRLTSYIGIFLFAITLDLRGH